MPNLAARVLFRSPTVAIIDSRCRLSATAVSEAPEKEAARGVHQLLILRAGMFVQHVGGSARRCAIVDPGTALFFNAGEIYRTTRHESAEGGSNVHDCTLLQFAPEEATAAIVGVADPSAVDRPSAPFSLPYGPFPGWLAFRHQALRARLRAGAIDPSAVEEEALGILAGAAASASRKHGGAPIKDSDGPTRRQHRQLAASVREQLAAAPTSSHPLAALARSVGCSSFHLARVFRREQGVTIHQHLVRLRLSLALQHLADGASNLAALAVELGFSNHSHFTELFRQTYGVTPSAARHRLSKGGSARVGWTSARPDSARERLVE